MKTIYTCLLIAIAFLGLTSLSNCTRDNDCPETKEEKINLTQDELSKIPYTGYDTLYFLNKQGDTCIVRGTGKQFYYDTEIGTGDPACPPPISTDYQAYKIKFVPVMGNLSFNLTMSTNQGQFEINDIMNFESGISFSVLYSLLGKVSGINNYIDSVKVGDKYYYKAYKMTLRKDGFIINNDTNKLAFINKDFGVLSIENDLNNSTYTIISK